MTKLSLQDLHILTQKKPVQVEIKKEGLLTKFKKSQEENTAQNLKIDDKKTVEKKEKTSLKFSKKQPLTPEEIEQKEKDRLEKINKQEFKKVFLEKRKKALEFLCETYPLCFDLHDPKPLKLHCDKEILLNLPKDVLFSKMVLRKALGVYTRRQKYLENFLNSSHRITLLGEEDALISESEKDFAKEKLEAVLEKNNQLRKEFALKKEKYNKWKENQEKAALKKENEVENL
ncbi:MAG TPA: ProQ/FINO family protein [Alphaproteobacteria bacterium]|nr:ProQ/FINO family protein [Alphaproteobacteria bacterium]